MRSTLLYGGRIYTVDPRQPQAEAVVVHGTDIVHVGSLDQAAAYVDASTERLDLRGGLCLPGFIDAHDHLAMGAVSKLGVNLSGVTGTQDVLDVVRRYVAETPGTSVLRGHGWYPASFDTRSPRREWLDAITGERPMVVASADMHDTWFNTAAMRQAGINASTPDPDPGSQYFVRDDDGTPTGHAVEGAGFLVHLANGTLSLETIRDSQALTLDRAPSWGITAYFEAGVLAGPSSASSEPVYADLIDRDRAGALGLRIAGSVFTRETGDDPGEIARELADWSAGMRSEHVSFGHCKMWSDGTLFSGGAELLEPSCAGTRGEMTFTREQVEEQIAAVQALGFDMHIHVDADGSTRTVLDALEAARRRPGSSGRRHTIAHNTLVHPHDIPRFAELGVIANGTPLWGTDYNGQYLDIYTELLGAERCEERLFPYGDLVRSGAVVTWGADMPGVDIDEIPPLLQLETLVTRQRPGRRDDRPLVPRQRIGLAQALRGYTIDAAYQLRMENLVGSLEVGKRADLVVLAEDLFAIDPYEIHGVPVVLTMMDGAITHRS